MEDRVGMGREEKKCHGPFFPYSFLLPLELLLLHNRLSSKRNNLTKEKVNNGSESKTYLTLLPSPLSFIIFNNK